MNYPLIRKSILKVLARVGDVYLREATLAAEVEIAIDRQLTDAEFADELRFLRERELIERDATLMGEPTWHITGKGKLAADEGVR